MKGLENLKKDKDINAILIERNSDLGKRFVSWRILLLSRTIRIAGIYAGSLFIEAACEKNEVAILIWTDI